jgi:soluble lytic murein transglycosylase
MKKRIAVIAIACIFLAAIALAVVFIFVRFPVRHLDIVREHAGDLPPALIMAVIMAESSFRENAESHVGAQGLMQIMPATAQDIARQMGFEYNPDDIWLPQTNIAMGAFYLNRLVQLFDGEVDTALAAYNAGRGRVAGWLADPRYSDDGRTLHTIPFTETENYLRRVNLNRRVYTVLLRLRGVR